MRRLLQRTFLLSLVLASGCSALTPYGATTELPQLHSLRTGKIAHVVIVVQENRSFDNLFATFPGADGATRGRDHLGRWVPLQKSNLVIRKDLGHDHFSWLTEYDDGRMDGFDVAWFARPRLPPLRTYAYRYVDPQQIAPYWTLAKRYVLADRMFMTESGDSFSSHQDLIAGGAPVSPDASVIGAPPGLPWGCDAAPGTRTPIITVTRAWELGPFPCFSYRTLRDTLDERGISWKILHAVACG